MASTCTGSLSKRSTRTGAITSLPTITTGSDKIGEPACICISLSPLESLLIEEVTFSTDLVPDLGSGDITKLLVSMFPTFGFDTSRSTISVIDFPTTGT
ncbi:hypothetical protein QL285_040347 [Trifolium repens]|nr:hypothetical protein QL285_040347 [Trifolium repens]